MWASVESLMKMWQKLCKLFKIIKNLVGHKLKEFPEQDHKTWTLMLW